MDGLFATYFNLGITHIIDFAGYDHMLFLLALCIPYVWKDWKKVVVMATAFTIGHSITLAVAIYDLVQFSTAWIEFFIPLTIVMMGVVDVFYKKLHDNRWPYIIALFFGFIHGMGFSNFLRSTLFPGEEHLLGWQLLSFNLGIEAAQIIVVIVLLILFSMIHKLISKNYSTFRLALSILVIVWAGYMCIQRWPM